jgi:hypothetical protein
MESGALPMCDCAGDEEENWRAVWKAGRRKVGMLIEDGEEEAITRRAGARVVESMVVWLVEPSTSLSLFK